MANTQINYACTCPILSTSQATAEGDLRVYPVDPILTMPYLYGLLLTSYSVSAPSHSVQVNATFRMTPTVGDATATATLVAGSASGAPVKSITVSGAGGLYARPPVVTLSGGGGSGAAAHANMQVGGTVVAAGGSGYSGATVASFQGGQLAPGGTPAVAGAVTVVGNAVTAVAVTTPGGPYDQPPVCVISDSGGGTGAVVMAGLSVASITLDSAGKGFTAAPTVVITPLFKQMFPDPTPNSNVQAATMLGWFVQAMQNLLSSPSFDNATVS